nr:hypothetical protein [uncultured Oscillibacter sp.]
MPSWNKSYKNRRKKRTGDENLLSGTFFSVVSFLRVGHGVDRDFLGTSKSNFLQQKTPEIQRFQVFSGAAGRIRTADLILTNWLGAFQPLRSNAFRAFLLQKDEVVSALCSIVSVCSFSRVGHGVGQQEFLKSRKFSVISSTYGVVNFL